MKRTCAPSPSSPSSPPRLFDLFPDLPAQLAGVIPVRSLASFSAVNREAYAATRPRMHSISRLRSLPFVVPNPLHDSYVFVERLLEADSDTFLEAVSVGALPACTRLTVTNSDVSTVFLPTLIVLVSHGTVLCDLTYLNLSGIGMNSCDLISLVTVLASNASLLPRCEHFEFYDNDIDDHGMRALAFAEESVTRRFATLDVSYNRIGELGVAYISVAMYWNKFTNLRTLGVGGNRIGDNGLNALRYALHFQRSIETVILDDDAADSPYLRDVCDSRNIAVLVLT